MTKLKFKTAPLPFQGQKRRFINSFALAMSQLKEKQEVSIIVDLFGGSGLLSYTAKRIFPNARVIYNDFDNYSERLLNIDKTNRLLSKIRELLKDEPKDVKLNIQKREQILKCVEAEDKAGYVDYITLSSSLLFSTMYVTNFEALRKEGLINRVKMSSYDFDSVEYLKGLDVVCSDYRLLYEKYKDIANVLFLVDPPYLSTDTKTYASDKYWKLRDYLDVLNVLSGTNYFFFTSNKSSLIELCEWFADNRELRNPFENSVLNTQNVTLNRSSKYTDMMLYKFIK